MKTLPPCDHDECPPTRCIQTANAKGVGSSELVRCWCRACKQDKKEEEMFAGIIHPDGIGRGICVKCHVEGKDVERWKRLDKESAPNDQADRSEASNT